MKNKIIKISLSFFFLCLFIVPYLTNASCSLSAIRSEYSSRGLSGSGMEQEAIDNCLKEQRIQDQRMRDQMKTDAENNQAFYQIQLNYFYKLDAIEKEIEALYPSDFEYFKYKHDNFDCSYSIRIPSDPTILDANVFLSLIENKEKCVAYLNEYTKPKIDTVSLPVTKIVSPPKQTRTNDQICSDKFGQNWKSISGSVCGCKDGYTQKNGDCVTYDQSCNISYSNSTFKKISETGTRICDCKSGYIWNEQRSGCIIAPIIPVKTNDQICQDKYDSNSAWDGTKNSIGEPNCYCKIGFMWNEQMTGCVVLPIAPEKTNNEICQDYFGINSNWDGTKNNDGGLVCDCQTGYEWNQGQTGCVVALKLELKTSIPAPAPKEEKISPILIEEKKEAEKEIDIEKPQNEMEENINNVNLASINSANQIATSTKNIQKKSLWTRMKNWFAFWN